MNASRIAGTLLTLASFALANAVFGQSYPSQSIRLIVPFAPGGGSDILARIVGQHLGTHLGQSVVIENKPGAGGTIGSDLVAKATPNGYTILLGSSAPQGIGPSLYKRIPYDAVKDFAPITLISSNPNLVVVSPDLPINSIADLIALAKSKPGTLTYATAGNGTSSHLSVELFKLMTGVDMVHVPYSGAGPATLAVVKGEASMAFVDPSGALPFARSGKLRAIAITGSHRSTAMPDIPTVAESGLPGYESIAWSGLLAPAGTPPDVVAKLNAEAVAALRQPDVTEQVSKLGQDIAASTPEQFAAFIKSEIAKWAKVVQFAKVQID
jgi:tripartite-type tricarboxylate transporter receptor subunit TctC